MTGIVFVTIALLALWLLYRGTGRDRWPVGIFIVWQVVTGTLAFSGVFEKNPGWFPFVLLGTVLITLLCLKMIRKQNVPFLLGIHVLRIPVELVLYDLYRESKVPVFMTFNGWNFDILVGISALGLLIYMVLTRRGLNRRLFMIWNVAGIGFLLFIVSLAVLSSPLPIQRLAFDQPNVAVLEFPYSFLPTCVVPVVLISHVLLMRSRGR